MDGGGGVSEGIRLKGVHIAIKCLWLVVCLWEKD